MAVSGDLTTFILILAVLPGGCWMLTVAVEVSVRIPVLASVLLGLGSFTASFLMTIFFMVMGDVVEMYPLGAEICLSIHFSGF